MPKVDSINCKTKGLTTAYLFAPAIANKSITTDDISVFKELNVNQLGLSKKDPQFYRLLII